MRQLVPEAATDIDPDTAYAGDERTPGAGRPWVLINMIASVDGATAVQGRSGTLGGPADKRVFGTIRSIADVILVAAGTVRAERYGPPKISEPRRAARRSRGQAELPRLAVVTRRLDLDLDLPLFDPAAERPIIVTSASAPADRREALEPHAEILVAGDEAVDMPDALAMLQARYQADIVLVEGGPSLNGALAEVGMIDEICLTLAPFAAGGASARIVQGAEPALRALNLTRVMEEDGFLFLRYAR